jgi:hypothetical protein
MGQLQLTAYGAIALLVVYYLYSRVARLTADSRFQKAYGCLSAKKYPQRGRILGLDLFFQRLKDRKNNNLLLRAIERFQKA